jgi:hypothetical protein
MLWLSLRRWELCDWAGFVKSMGFGPQMIWIWMDWSLLDLDLSWLLRPLPLYGLGPGNWIVQDPLDWCCAEASPYRSLTGRTLFRSCTCLCRQLSIPASDDCATTEQLIMLRWHARLISMNMSDVRNKLVLCAWHACAQSLCVACGRRRAIHVTRTSYCVFLLSKSIGSWMSKYFWLLDWMDMDITYLNLDWSWTTRRNLGPQNGYLLFGLGPLSSSTFSQVLPLSHPSRTDTDRWW